MADLKPVLTYWLNICRLSGDTVTASGGRWSDGAESFHRALLTSLPDQIEAVDPAYARRLRSAGQPVSLPGR